MFDFFRKKFGNKNQSEEKKTSILLDLDGNLLQEGDIVKSLRYNLGRCKVVLLDGNYYYESLETGEQVSWLKMIDASTEHQKVKKN